MKLKEIIEILASNYLSILFKMYIYFYKSCNDGYFDNGIKC